VGNPSRAWVIGYGEDAGMAKADYRTKARECYRMAAMAPSPADPPFVSLMRRSCAP
jgi:hypothetical protein